MAERTVTVCDICGKSATDSVTFKAGKRSLAQDLCSTHFQDLVRHSHAPKRGRRRSAASPVRRKTTAKKTSRRQPAPSSSRSSTSTSSPRKRLTDPTTLAKRRAGLTKARQALAKKRATAVG